MFKPAALLRPDTSRPPNAYDVKTAIRDTAITLMLVPLKGLRHRAAAHYRVVQLAMTEQFFDLYCFY